jgi:guanylate kinase
VGKSTLAKRLVQNVDGLIFSISFTTRPPRREERDGVDYFFLDDTRFDAMVEEGGFVEWVRVYDRRYGTGRVWLEQNLASGVDVLLDVETTGALNIHQALPDATMIFLLPPSAQEMERRLRGRGTDGEEQVAVRLKHARHEMELYEAYDYLIVNDDIDRAYLELESVIRAVRAQREHRIARAEAILATFQK